MNDAKTFNGSAEAALCLQCGLCCNGVIFADVKLQRADDAARLRSLGLSVSIPHSSLRTPHLNQPCAALEGCRCRIYAERPGYCRQFDCLLLKSVKAGRMQPAAALRKISTAQARAQKVRVLLRALGDTDEHLALSTRFRRVARRMNKSRLSPGTAEAYGELTLAVQGLNVVLSEGFYPGDVMRDA